MKETRFTMQLFDNAKTCGRSDSVYALAPQVVFSPGQDGSARLLDMGGKFFALSKSAAEMVSGLLEHDVDATVATLAEQYDVEPQRVRDDVLALATNLRRQGLLRQRGAPAVLHLRSFGATLLMDLAIGVARCRALSQYVQATLLLLLARISFALYGWARTVAACRSRLSGQAAPTSTDTRQLQAQAVAEAVRQAAAHLLVPVACKEKALTSWILARFAGISADLIVGLQSYPLVGHCWCEAGPWNLSDDRERCAAFAPVLRYCWESV
jgi:hypothetical protein